MSSNEIRQRKSNPVPPQVDSSKQAVVDEATRSAMQLAQERYTKFFTRSIWGLLMIIVFGFILYSDHTLVCVFVVLLQMGVFRELINLRYVEAKEKKLWGFRTLHWWFLFTTDFYVYAPPAFFQLSRMLPIKALEVLYRYHLALSFSFYVVGFLFFVLTLKKSTYKYQLGQITWTMMTLLLVVGQSHFTILNIFRGLIWFILPCSLIICNDIMAYFCGFFFGKRFISRPLTKLSPNKTWEGFIGAFICTVIFAFFFSRILAGFSWFTCPYVAPDTFSEIFNRFSGPSASCANDAIFQDQLYPLPIIGNIAIMPVQLHAIVFALFASLIAPFGGFFASAIKRAYNVKDFDSIFPGHGGITDRMDCQLINGLFVYVYLSTFIKSVEPAQLLFLISQLPREDQIFIFEELKKSIL